MRLRNFRFALTQAVAAAGLLAASWVQAAQVGAPAPALSLPKDGGGTASLADYRGQVVYLDFWASWCGPCRESLPWMNEMQRKYAGQGLAVVAVNVDQRQADAEAFLARLPMRFTVLYDPAGTTPALYQVLGMPTSFLIGRNGRVLARHSSFRAKDKAPLETEIKAALAADPSP